MSEHFPKCPFQAKCIYPYTAEEDREISVKPGDLLLVESTNTKGWALARKAQGERGWIPADFVEPIKETKRPTKPKPAEEPAAAPVTSSPAETKEELEHLTLERPRIAGRHGRKRTGSAFKLAADLQVDEHTFTIEDAQGVSSVVVPQADILVVPATETNTTPCSSAASSRRSSVLVTQQGEEEREPEWKEGFAGFGAWRRKGEVKVDHGKKKKKKKKKHRHRHRKEKKRKLSKRPKKHTTEQESFRGMAVCDGDGVFSLEEGIESVRFGFFQTCLLVMVAFTKAAEGMELVLIPILINQLKCSGDLHSPSTADLSALSTLSLMGACVGLWFFGMLADRVGRRPALIFATFLSTLFAILSSFAVSITPLLLYRAVVGFSLGGTAPALALFVEHVTAERRGRRLLIFLGCFSLGTLFEIVLAWAITPVWGWRGLLFVSALPSAFFFFAQLQYLPESPHYLLTQARAVEAEDVLRQAADSNDSVLPPGSLRQESWVLPRSIWQIVTPTLRSTTVLLFVLFTLASAMVFCLSVLTMAVVGTFDPPKVCLFSDVHFTHELLSNIGEVPGLILAFFLVDSWGRKFSLIFFFFFSSLALFLLFIPLPVFVLSISIVAARACALAYQQLLWLYAAEVYPTTCRAVGIATCSSFGFLALVLCPAFVDTLFEQNKQIVLTACGTPPLLCILFVALLVFDPANTALADWVSTVEMPGGLFTRLKALRKPWSHLWGSMSRRKTPEHEGLLDKSIWF